MLSDNRHHEVADEAALNEIFGRLLSTERFSDPVTAIVNLIHTHSLDTKKLTDTLKEYQIKDLGGLKHELLDVLILYVNVILKDHLITASEHRNFAMLKRFFKIQEGDFYSYRRSVIRALITTQLQSIYNDGNIDQKEAVHKVNLQGLFDLSYDQFLEFAEGEILEALRSGADIEMLDTVRYPKGFKK